MSTIKPVEHTIDAARISIQVDIGFGDAVTPGPVEINYPTLLDAPAPHLRAYPVETVVAEKFEALVTLGMPNSRLKDFYDLWLIAQTFEFRRSSLIEPCSGPSLDAGQRCRPTRQSA